MNLAKYDAKQLDGWELMLLRSAHDISISPSHYDVIEQRYGTLRQILASGSEALLADAHVFPQGSIRLKTAIKPVPGASGSMATIDADAVVWLPNANQASSGDILTAIKQRFTDGVRVDSPIEDLRRGIRIVYGDEDPGFHIDVTPSRNTYSNDAMYGIGNLQVPDRNTGWKGSSPIAYSDWLEGVADLHIEMSGLEQLQKREIVFAEATQEELPTYDDYVDGNVLRATIKLLKRHRDKWAIGTKNEETRPISAVITTLAGLAYEKIVEESKTVKRRPIEAMFEIIDRMPQYITRENDGYHINNPRDKDENFGEKWNRPNGEGIGYKKAFDHWHERAAQDIRLGLTDFGSTASFSEQMSSRFGVSKSMIVEFISDLPGDWPQPGRELALSKNTESLRVLSGISVASIDPQISIKPVERLG